MKQLQKAIGLLNTILIALAGLALLALTGIAVTNVVMRLAGLQYVGAYELIGFCGAIVVAAALGQTQQRKDHVPVDIITKHFPVALNRAIDLFKYGLKFAFAAIVAWYTLRWGIDIGRSGEVSETLKIPFYPFIFAVAGGFAVLACTVLLDIARTLAEAWPKSPAKQPAMENVLEEQEVPLP
ncbi:MAG TPA: TRAP transporter small permease [Tepidisphaeraceae bacterium]|nr:TRAP transporter small permease [Tepidisphaeraceae bacterium]